MLMEELTSLIQELKEERSNCSNQGEEMVEVFIMPETPKEVMRLTTSQGALPNLPRGQEPGADGLFPRSGPQG